MQKLFDHYYLTQLLDQQKFKTTYLAYPQGDMNSKVVVKIFDRECTISNQDHAKSLLEIKSFLSLEHPHIVPVLNMDVVNKTPYIVTQYMSHGSLHQIVDDWSPKLLSWVEAVNIVTQVAQALIYAHEHGIIHGDIKPSNILFDAEGKVLLTDFRPAYFIDVAKLDYKMDLQTTAYMAPEQFVGQATTYSDQYSLACIAYELITGHGPFWGAQNFSLMWNKHATEHPLPLTALIPELPVAIESAILKAMAKTPEMRYPNVEAFAYALENGVSTSTISNVVLDADMTWPAIPVAFLHKDVSNSGIKDIKGVGDVRSNSGIRDREAIIDMRSNSGIRGIEGVGDVRSNSGIRDREATIDMRSNSGIHGIEGVGDVRSNSGIRDREAIIDMRSNSGIHGIEGVGDVENIDNTKDIHGVDIADLRSSQVTPLPPTSVAGDVQGSNAPITPVWRERSLSGITPSIPLFVALSSSLSQSPPEPITTQKKQNALQVTASTAVSSLKNRRFRRSRRFILWTLALIIIVMLSMGSIIHVLSTSTHPITLKNGNRPQSTTGIQVTANSSTKTTTKGGTTVTPAPSGTALIIPANTNTPVSTSTSVSPTPTNPVVQPTTPSTFTPEPARNLALGAVPYASSSYEAYGWGLRHVNDGITNSIPHAMGWTSNSNLGVNHTEWVSLDLGSVVPISSIDLYPRNDGKDAGEGFPIDFQIVVSNDASNWTVVLSESDYPLPSSGAVQTFSFATQSARYIGVQATTLRQIVTEHFRYRMQFAEIAVY